MNTHDLREAQARYENQKEEVLNSRKKLYQLRNEFVGYFNRNKICNMQINEYVIGVSKNGFNFCYGLERQLDGLGRIIGATALKFGVYYGRTKSDENHEYRFIEKFGNTYQEAFQNVREAIIQLLKASESENIETIVKNPLSPMFKGKILCTYFPERYLNIFSDDHLNYFLTQLDLDTVVLSDPVYKRDALIAFKNQDPVMRNWSVDLFANFLYTEYPGRPPKKNQEATNDDPLVDYRIPNFPSNPTPTFIDLKILLPKPAETINRKNGKTDYEKKTRINKKLGDRGEKIVMDLEKSRLSKAGRNDLVNKIDRVSLKSDALGYDIISFDEDGTERYIEVKATRSSVGVANFFFTANELQAAQENKNYYIYMVYEVTTDKPKVWAIKNPFNPENKNIIKTPINYKITINTEL
jgi:hypothetical protein